MAAGLGYIEFTTGDVLTAASANGYLASQVVMVFASAAARTSAIASPQEGMISYLKDTNSTEYYSGSAWVAIGGGGLSSPLTTKGDVWGYSTTNARIPVGTNGQVLTADSVEALGVKWATPSGSSGPTFSAYSTTAQSVSQSTNTKVTFDSEYWDTAGNFASSRFTPTTAGYYQVNALISYSGASGSTFRTMIYKNGASYDAGFISIGVAVANPALQANTLVYFNGSSDYIELYGWTDAAGTREFYRSYFSAAWIRG